MCPDLTAHQVGSFRPDSKQWLHLIQKDTSISSSQGATINLGPSLPVPVPGPSFRDDSASLGKSVMGSVPHRLVLMVPAPGTGPPVREHTAVSPSACPVAVFTTAKGTGALYHHFLLFNPAFSTGERAGEEDSLPVLLKTVPEGGGSRKCKSHLYRGM